MHVAKFNRILTQIETGFNVLDSLPVVSVASSLIRATAGKVQMLVGAFLALTGTLGQLINSSDQKKWEKLTKIGLEHMTHGGLNLLRGAGEFLLGVYTYGIGNLVLFGIQFASENGFEPHVKYGIFSEKRVYLLV